MDGCRTDAGAVANSGDGTVDELQLLAHAIADDMIDYYSVYDGHATALDLLSE
jgi:hypothetical protein